MTVKQLTGRIRFSGLDTERLTFTPGGIDRAGVTFYAEDTNITYEWTGTTWLAPATNPGDGPGVMMDHGNEYHTPDMEPANNNIQAHVTSLHAPTNAQKNSDITKGEIEAKLTGEISTHTHAKEGITLASVYPIGSVYISIVATNPNTLFGMGTWQAISAGRVLVGVNSLDPDFDTVEETGGAKTVAASAQTFAGNPLASHQHAAITAGTPAGTVGGIAATATAASKVGTSTANVASNAHTHPAPAFTGNAMATHQHTGITAGTPSGTNTPGAASSVVQPYFTVYIWKRTA